MMFFQLFLGIIFLYIAYFVLTYSRIPDSLYYQPILSQNAQNLVFCITLISGLYCLLIAYKFYQRDKNKPKIKIIEYSICPKCKEAYNYQDLEDGLCPKCNIKTKDLDGYYDKN